MPGGTVASGTGVTSPTPGYTAGSIMINPSSIGPAFSCDQIVVASYQGPVGQGDPTYLPTPELETIRVISNVRCTSIAFREGAEPGTAEFIYVFDDTRGNSLPWKFEHVYPLNAQGPGVVRNDDRIVVYRVMPNGRPEYLFDGFAQVPEVRLGGETEAVSFRALGYPVRCSDTPMAGAIYRHADKPHDPGTEDVPNDVPTDLPCRFNPDGEPNATPDDGDTYAAIGSRPAFFDHLIVRTPEVRRHWTLGMAARYLLLVGESKQAFVKYEAAIYNLDDLLSVKIPKDGNSSYNPDDSTTYDLTPIYCPDIDVTGMTWPEALERLIAPHGFGFRFQLSTTDANLPEWNLYVFRKDRAVSRAPVRLQNAGASIDLGQSNLGAAQLSRDSSHLVNEFYADSKPVRYEASFVLAPGFTITATDADTVNAAKFKSDSPDFNTAQNSIKYRNFLFGEAGDSWWDFAAAALKTDVPTLDKVISLDGLATVEDGPRYARRRRPGLPKLLTTDTDGGERKAELWVSTDYTGPSPGVWDRDKANQNWVKVTKGGWKLSKDRLGIELTMINPNSWSFADDGVPAKTQPALPAPAWDAPACLNSGKFQVIKAMAAPDAPNPRFYFRLTCVIEGDTALKAVAEKRAASPTRYKVIRRDDVRDRYERGRVVGSRYNSVGSLVTRPEDGTLYNSLDTDSIDETTQAIAHASQRRAAHETPRLGGTLTIPWLTSAYRIGSAVTGIEGRNVSLRTNGGDSVEDSPRYPIIVGIDYMLDGQQSTSLHLADRRAEPVEHGVGDLT